MSSSPKMNQYFVAELWKRGKGVRRRVVVADMEKDADLVLVQLVDYGTYEQVGVGRLLPLHVRFAQQPRFSVLSKWVFLRRPSSLVLSVYCTYILAYIGRSTFYIVVFAVGVVLQMGSTRQRRSETVRI